MIDKKTRRTRKSTKTAVHLRASLAVIAELVDALPHDGPELALGCGDGAAAWQVINCLRDNGAEVRETAYVNDSESYVIASASLVIHRLTVVAQASRPATEEETKAARGGRKSELGYTCIRLGEVAA